MKSKSPKKAINKDGWMNTYSDMVTLLLCFFVLLFASSNVDSAKWEILVRGLNPDAEKVSQIAETDNPGEEDGLTATDGKGLLTDVETFQDIYWQMKEYVEKNELSADVEVVGGVGYTFLVFRNSIFFDGDQYFLKPEGKRVLDFLCDGLRKVSGDIQEIEVLGHTNQADPNKPNEAKGDWRLSTNRAVEVVYYMQAKNFIDPKKFTPIGKGQHYPIAPFIGEGNRAQNRRVEILIQEIGSVSVTLEEIYEKMGSGEDSPVVNVDAPDEESQSTVPPSSVEEESNKKEGAS